MPNLARKQAAALYAYGLLLPARWHDYFAEQYARVSGSTDVLRVLLVGCAVTLDCT